MKRHARPGIYPDKQLGIARARQSHLYIHGRAVVQRLIVRPVVKGGVCPVQKTSPRIRMPPSYDFSHIGGVPSR